MNKKEISELKKQLHPDRFAAKQIHGCYVNGDKEIVSEFHQSFGAMGESEQCEYLSLFQKIFSGKIGTNLHTLVYKNEEHSSDKMYQLLKSGLNTQEMLHTFYQDIINTYSCDTNYCILLTHNIYDVAGSEEDVFSHILCAICPVKLTKSKLCLDDAHTGLKEELPKYACDNPMHGFLYPSFTDRTSNVNELLFYNKKASDLKDSFLEATLNLTAPHSIETYKAEFASALPEMDAKKYEELIGALNVISFDKDMVDDAMLKEALRMCGMETENTLSCEIPKSLMCGPLKVKSCNTSITTDVEVEFCDINNRKCIVIPLDTNSVDVNGFTLEIS